MMGGLSNSRHARPGWQPPTSTPTSYHQPPAKPRDSTATPPPLTITPAPTGYGSITPSWQQQHHQQLQQQQHPQPSPHPELAAAAHELNRYAKIVRRLKWKLPFLSTAYQQAVDRVGRDPSQFIEAELMFKLDFFEYYMLLERALVHLQSVFGIAISRGSPRAGAGLSGSLWRSGGGGGGNGGQYQHRYHANVLAALDNVENPLHGCLGVGEVRKQLGRAKELRNRWKTAGEEEEGERRAGSPTKRGRGMARPKMAAPLESYDLERILSTIFDGFDAAFLVAERYVRSSEESPQGMMADADLMISEEEQWEFMVDAMDWEAV